MPLVEMSDASAAIPLPAIPVAPQLSANTTLELLRNPIYTQINGIVRPVRLRESFLQIRIFLSVPFLTSSADLDSSNPLLTDKSTTHSHICRRKRRTLRSEAT